MDNLYNRYGNLDDKDIKQLIQISEMLPYFAELSHNDIFVDCFSEREELAIVVAHGTPQTSESLYKDKVVGKIVLPENEPCVFFCKKTETSVRDLKGVTQEGKAVMQQAVPIKNDVGRVIGVLIEEQNVTDYIVQEEKIKYLKKCDSENGMGFDSVSNIAMDHIKEGVVLFDSNLNSVYVNKDAKRIYRNIGFEEEIF